MARMEYRSDAVEGSYFVMGAKAAQFIFLIVLMTTMTNIDGKLYWLVNLVSLIPQLITISVFGAHIKSDSDVVRKFLPIVLFIEILVASMQGIEVFLVSLDSFYETSVPGKIIMQLISIAFVVFWSLSYKVFFDYNEHMLPEDEKNNRKEKRQPKPKKPKPGVDRVSIQAAQPDYSNLFRANPADLENNEISQEVLDRIAKEEEEMIKNGDFRYGGATAQISVNSEAQANLAAKTNETSTNSVPQNQPEKLTKQDSIRE